MSHSIPASVWVPDSLSNCLCTVFFDRRAGHLELASDCR